MRLSECLNSSDINTLRKIAETHDFECHRSSKNALIQSIMSHFNDRKFIREKLTQLSGPAYREALVQLTIDHRTAFSKEDLLAIAQRAAVNQTDLEKSLVTRLLEDGWMFRLGSQGGRNTYYFPEDTLKTIREYVSEHLRDQVETVTVPPVVYRDDQLAIIRDIAHFLSYVKNNEVKLTMDGIIFKRQLILLLESMEIQEKPLDNVGWRFGYGRRFRDYPDRFALLYDYCYNRQLIAEEDQGTLSLTAKAEEWIQRDDRDKLFDLFRFWRLLYRRPIPKIALAVSTLARAVQKQWTLVDSINRLLKPYVNDYYYDTPNVVMDTRIYQMMINLGLLCHGKLGDGRYVIKLSDVGRDLLLEDTTPDEAQMVENIHVPPILIQPNFDILLPAEEAASVGWELSQFADLIRPDAMRVYRITKRSIERGLQAGWTVNTILEFLDLHSEHSVPRNVVRMIEQWGKTNQEVRMVSCTLLEFANESVVKQVLSHEKFHSLVVKRLDENQLLLPMVSQTEVQAFLHDIGYATQVIP